MKPNNRIAELDILKGIGIIMVILGHSVPDFPINLRADIVSSTIESVLYGFHMPLFFLSAGYVLQMTENQSSGLNISWIFKKSKRLLVPYFIFSFISLTLRWVFSSFTRSTFKIGTSLYGIFFEGKYFWFLYVMFSVLVMIELLRMLKVQIKVQLLVAFILYLIGLLIDSSFLCINRFGYYLIYTILGMIIYHKRDNVRAMLGRWYNCFILVSLFIVFFRMRLLDCLYIRELSRFVVALTGTGVTYSLSLLILEKSDKFNLWLSYFGKMSLQYYLVHMIIQLPIYYLVAELSFESPFLSVLTIFIITTILTYVIVEMLCRVPVFCFALGMTKRK